MHVWRDGKCKPRPRHFLRFCFCFCSFADVRCSSRVCPGGALGLFQGSKESRQATQLPDLVGFYAELPS